MTVRKHLRDWEILGFLVVGAMGVLLHYVYDWSGGNRFVAAFAGVNDSTWEHIKLLYLPYFVFTVAEYPVFAEPYRNFFAAKATAGLCGMLLIPLLHYTAAGMFGAPPSWLNIVIFYLADAAMYLISYRLLIAFALRGAAWQITGFLLLWAALFAFVYFTYRPPQIPLFRDPTTFQYGIPTPERPA